MTLPFVIWAASRTGSTLLAESLGAESEPFQNGQNPNRLGHLYDHYLNYGSSGTFRQELVSICRQKKSFKHLPEGFDPTFNIILAQTTTLYGYRHVHLIRRSELARLISLDLAIQLDAWKKSEAKDKLQAVEFGRKQIKPLDIRHLIENYQTVIDSWSCIEPELSLLITIVYEQLTAPSLETRSYVLQKIRSFLGLPDVRKLEEAIILGGQNSQSLRKYLPNIPELKNALIERGRL